MSFRGSFDQYRKGVLIVRVHTACVRWSLKRLGRLIELLLNSTCITGPDTREKERWCGSNSLGFRQDFPQTQRSLLLLPHSKSALWLIYICPIGSFCFPLLYFEGAERIKLLGACGKYYRALMVREPSILPTNLLPTPTTLAIWSWVGSLPS